MGRSWWVICVVAACGADTRRESGSKPVAPAVGVQQPDAAVAEIDVGEALVVTKDAGAPTGKPEPCFCFSWVHLDENGQRCYPTKATCDAEFTSFGRSTKIPCGEEQDRCDSYACRHLGKECFAL